MLSYQFQFFSFNLRKVLTAPFFNKPTLQVAPKLLGKSLVRKMGKREITGIITEVEAYVGPQDHASHAFRGRTSRSEVMFGKPGIWYVYLIYGMHHCLNIVADREGYPAAILIRSVAFRPFSFFRPRTRIKVREKWLYEGSKRIVRSGEGV